MKYILFTTAILTTLLYFGSCTSQQTTESASQPDISVKIQDSLPKKLAGLKTGLKVTNEPETVYAGKFEKDTSFFIWKMQTTVTSLNEDIKIIEFGDYKLNNDGTWSIHTQTGYPFNTNDFKQWYFKSKNGNFTWENSKDGTIAKGEKYIDPNNWTLKNKELIYQKGIWYFIGINKKGEKVFGYARYENVPEIKK